VDTRGLYVAFVFQRRYALFRSGRFDLTDIGLLVCDHGRLVFLRAHLLNTLKTTGSGLLLLKCRISQTSRSKGPDVSVSVYVPVFHTSRVGRPTFERQLRRFQKNGHRCNGIKANRCVKEADEIWRDPSQKNKKWVD
jgi:hypothetical protein